MQAETNEETPSAKAIIAEALETLEGVKETIVEKIDEAETAIRMVRYATEDLPPTSG